MEVLNRSGREEVISTRVKEGGRCLFVFDSFFRIRECVRLTFSPRGSE